MHLPWKLSLDVATTDTIGMALAQQGLYDVVTTELVWRLAEPGEIALDVGANIGYFTSLLAVRLGTGGVVYSWEPHPQTFQSLRKNAEQWQTSPALAKIVLTEAALSSQEGMASLAIPEGEEVNLGCSFLSSEPSAHNFQVRTQLLSSFLDSTGPIGVMKLDVERHETQVLEGAGKYLMAGKIRDIVFEEHDAFPAASHKILMAAGYKLYWFEERLRGVKTLPVTSSPRRREYDLPPSFVATRDAERLERLFAEAGWKSF
ncbi:MAG: FkbM family methyltransferase [Candidatus Acidiferrum sp.]